MVNIEKIFYQVVKKDLSPDWEDASTKLTDVEVTASFSYLDFLWNMIKLLIRSNTYYCLIVLLKNCNLGFCSNIFKPYSFSGWRP